MIRFETTLGVVPGYEGAEELAWSRPSAVQRVAELWNWHMGQELQRTGRIISAIITPSLAVYPGCVAGGEETVTVSGTKHPHETCSVEDWKGSVRVIVYMLRVELRQRTAMIVFSDAEVKYLVGEEMI